jgi:hypothetical protein
MENRIFHCWNCREFRPPWRSQAQLRYMEVRMLHKGDISSLKSTTVTKCACLFLINLSIPRTMAPQVLVVGASGYGGNDLITQLVNDHPNYQVAALICKPVQIESFTRKVSKCSSYCCHLSINGSSYHRRWKSRLRPKVRYSALKMIISQANLE